MKIAITGFGRIGRQLTRLFFNNKNMFPHLELVAINDVGKHEISEQLFNFDSLHGPFSKEVNFSENEYVIDGQSITRLNNKNPLELNWKSLGVDLVLECTGYFRTHEKASQHIKAGASKVLISAPSPDPDLMVVYGINHKLYDSDKHNILSSASCTTNCLTPIVQVLNKSFGIEKGLITTIHSYTSDQKLLDNSHKDPRRARAAAINMVPTTTGAAKAVGRIIPELDGKLDGLAVRVPTPNVSLTDFVAELKTEVTTQEINSALKKAADTDLKNILKVHTGDPVSSDLIGDINSSIVDSKLTRVLGNEDKGNMVKVLSWYDNEAGFSCRMLDFAEFIAAQ